ncbi:hypothetical protein MY4824_006260 [Beauveria thailandica]
MNPDSDNVGLANCSPHTPSAASLIDDEMMGKLAIMFVDAGELPGRASHTVRGESSCEDNVSYIDSVRCPCSHDYCRTCIAGLFEAAISDESRFPARCCRQAIPLGLNQIFIPAELAGRYHAKEVEYGTLNRTYCHRSSCSTFVPPQFVRGRTATCVKCRGRTCTDCKREAHPGDCLPDAATLDVLRLANARGWQRCSSCHHVVELSTGCNHISCRCGAQFCYIEMWIEILMTRNERFEWNKSSRTCETITNVDMRPGDYSQEPSSARSA